MHSSISFGRLVRQRRKALDLTQAALARQVGCAEITIRKIEADEIRPSRQFLSRLADQLLIDVDQRAQFLATGRGASAQQPYSLPLPPNPLIGRAAEIAAVQARFIADGVRLLTLTGPGGVGKTRLSLQVAHEMASAFHDGVCFVALAALSDTDLVGVAIAQALGLEDARNVSLAERLQRFLHDKSILLVLDNFEQIADAAPLVATLLAQCPQLSVLVTSRIALHLSGEHEFAVQPLPLPAPRSTQDDLSASPAVALFVARARAARADFTLTTANAPTIAEICARLDGLPLAIELAAAWLKLLTPDALLARLSGAQPLNMLQSGARDLPARQQTLRNAIAWSYQLLAPAQQKLFRTLGICVGGCGLETVEGIAADLLPTLPDLLAALATLVDGSLLRQEIGRIGAVRVGMLETIREYALELLSESGEIAAARQRHAQTFLALAESARPHLQDIEQEIWLDRLEDDHDNLRAALEWSRSSGGDVALGVRLVEALWEFWLVRGHIGEGRAWMASLLDLTATDAPTHTRARALGGAGRLAWAQNNWQEATNLLQASRSLCAALGDEAGSANALNHLGEVAEAQGDYARAAEFFVQSLALFQQLDDREGSAAVLVSYGQMMQAQGQHQQAAELVAASLTLFEEAGDRRGLAVALTVQGQVMHALGDYHRADQVFAQSLELFGSLGYRHGMGWALTNQGQAVLAQGDYQRAEQLFAQSLAFYAELGDQRGQAWAMTNQGQAAHAHGDSARALTLSERSVALFDALGDQRGYAWALYYAGRSAGVQGNYTLATSRFMESLELFQTLNDNWFSALCLSGLAAICCKQAHPLAAVRLFAAADALRSTSHILSKDSDYTAVLEELHHSMNEAIFATEWQIGRTLSLDQALDLAKERLLVSSDNSEQ